MRQQTAAVILACSALIAACGDGGAKSGDAPVAVTTSTLGPDRTEGNVAQATLESFNGFLPDDVNGWRKQEPLGYYSGTNASTATATYQRRGAGPTFAVVLTLSNTMVSQTQSLIADPKLADSLGFEVSEFSGLPALAGKEGGTAAGTVWTVVLTNSRMVQVQFSPADGLTRADTRAVFEKVDFKGIATK